MKHKVFILFLCLTTQTIYSQKYYKDIPYIDTLSSSLSSYQKERCKLDIQMPKKAEGKPTVIFFHGGGLTGGEKYVPYEIISNNLIGVGVNYRLSPRAKCPAYLEDAAAAVAWVYKHIKEYGGDQSKIYVTGASAGAYLSTMLALDTTYLAAHGIQADSIAGYLPLSAQTTTHFTILAERGVNVGSDSEFIDQYAPLSFNRKVLSQMLFVIGDRHLDMPGRYDQNTTIVNQLRRNATKVHLWEIKGKDHNTFVAPALSSICRLIKNDSLKFTKDSIFFQNNLPSEKITKNIFYCEDNKDGYTLDQRLNCRLDISIPEEVDSSKSTLIFFQTEDFKQSSGTIPEVIGRKGVIGVGAKIRTSPSSAFPDYIKDAAAAIAWIYRNIDEYGGNRKRIYVAGSDAGGYLSALLALDSTYLKRYDLHPDSIKGFLAISSQLTTHPTILAEKGMIADFKTEIIDKDSPLFHRRRLNNSLLLIIGDRFLDLPGRYIQNRTMVNQLRDSFPNSSIGLWEMNGKSHKEINDLALDSYCEMIIGGYMNTNDSLLYENIPIKDISYCESSNPYQKNRCKLDIKSPKTTSKDLSTIIFFHEGDFTIGEKYLPEELINDQTIVVSPNYRLSPSAHCPSYIDDAAAAVAWVYNNIEEYGGNRNKIYVAGISSGGYLTAMLALDTTYLAKEGICSDSIAGYFPISTQMTTHTTILREQGVDANSDSEFADEYAPISHIRTIKSPLQLVIGDRYLDLPGRYEQNESLERLIKKTNPQLEIGLWQMCTKDHCDTKSASLIEISKAIACIDFAPYDFLFFEVLNDKSIKTDHQIQVLKKYSVLGKPIENNTNKSEIEINIGVDKSNKTIVRKIIRSNN